jgi:hypothetical protein
MSDWYTDYIEKGVRPVVKLLRDNGFNTVCSCGHEMYVDSEYYRDDELHALDELLFNNGYRNYSIACELERIDGAIITSMLHLKLKQGEEDARQKVQVDQQSGAL